MDQYDNEYLQSNLYDWLMRKTNVSAVRRISELPIAIGSDMGNVRTENQDRVALLKVKIDSQSFGVIALCDGMGGMTDGSACASHALSCFFNSCIKNRGDSPTIRLTKAAQDANQFVYNNYKGSGGSTLSAILIEGDGDVTGVNIGDSRIYLNNELNFEQLTVDDTLSHRNGLLQYIGMGDGVEPHIINIPMQNNYLVLTSDGIHYINNELMRTIIINAREPAIAVKRLVEIAKWCGGLDNASIAIFSHMFFDHPSSKDNGSIQVWDPYGEIKILLVEKINNCEIYNNEKNNQPSANPENNKLSKKYQKKNTPCKRNKKLKDEYEIIDETDQPQVTIYINDNIIEGKNE